MRYGAALFGLLIGQAAVFAILPEAPSGQMVFDKVEDTLRRCRLEKYDDERLEMLDQLAPRHDPRVAVALGEMLDKAVPGSDLEGDVAGILRVYYIPDGYYIKYRKNGSVFCAKKWWKEYEADLRRGIIKKKIRTTDGKNRCECIIIR